MATQSDVQIHALSVEAYDKKRTCHECGEEKPTGFEWMVVTCGCGCGSKKELVIYALLELLQYVMV